MKKNKFWFSFIELIVWVSITVILMISVWIIVSSWMKNITIQKQILDQNSEIWNFNENLNNIFSPWFEIITYTSTSALVKSNYILWKPKYYYLSEITSTWFCENDLNLKNKYIQIQNFNPFLLSWSTYSWSYIKNEIYSWWQVIVWKWFFWSDFISWSAWTWVYLNNPSSITNSWNLVFISDSANNRIYYLSWNIINKLLDIDDWFFSPTWLIYNSWALYILNSWKKELLKLTSSSNSNASWNNIDINIKPQSNINNIKKLTLEILPNDFVLTWSYNSWSFNFSPNLKNPSWDIWWTWALNRLDYTFSWVVSLNSLANYNIKVPISWEFLTWTTYYFKTQFFDNSSNVIYEKYFPYIINSDDDLTTIDDNTLENLTWSLNYDYTDLSFSWSNLLLQDFLNEKYLKLTQTWWFIWTWSIGAFQIDDFENIKEISNFKIKDFKIFKDTNILNILIEYYKIFDCYNEDLSITKAIIFKKTF